MVWRGDPLKAKQAAELGNPAQSKGIDGSKDGRTKRGSRGTGKQGQQWRKTRGRARCKKRQEKQTDNERREGDSRIQNDHGSKTKHVMIRITEE